MAETEGVAVLCANPECRVSETGLCIEGMQKQDCPHFGRVRDETAIQEMLGGEPVEDHGVRLPSADTLTSTDVKKTLCKTNSRVIAIVGPSDAGKTSLIAAFYDLFQVGAVLEAEFAGSLTFHAFELACHDARMASRRTTPHISRTPVGDVRFYHIDLRRGSAGGGVALLLGDRAGEEYKNSADDVALALNFFEIPRADSLTMLVDGERLMDLRARHNLRSQVNMILQAFVESGALTVGHRLALVLTKMDVLHGYQDKDRVTADFDSIANSVRTTFGDVFAEIQQFQVAASPKTDSVQRGEGLNQLLNFWTGQKRYSTKKGDRASPSPRAFSRLSP